MVKSNLAKLMKEKKLTIGVFLSSLVSLERQ